MRALVLSLASLLALAFGATGGLAGTTPALEISSNQARMHFPDSISFQIDVTSASSITSVVLEYGDVQKTCGEVVAEAFPQFESSAHVRSGWAWDMRQSGSLPPGTRL